MSESGSMYDLVCQSLRRDPQSLSKACGKLASNIVKLRGFAIPIERNGGQGFKIPTRSTLSETRKETWLSDLKHLDESLYKLMKNAPIGFRGEKILELMYDRNIPLQRATWYIKIVRINEMYLQRKRERLKFISDDCTLDWTLIVCSHLTKLLVDLDFPLTAVKDATALPVIKKWTYMRNLLVWQWKECLLENHLMYNYFCDLLASCTHNQLYYLLDLIHHLNDVLVNSSYSGFQCILSCLLARIHMEIVAMSEDNQVLTFAIKVFKILFMDRGLLVSLTNLKDLFYLTRTVSKLESMKSLMDQSYDEFSIPSMKSFVETEITNSDSGHQYFTEFMAGFNVASNIGNLVGFREEHVEPILLWFCSRDPVCDGSEDHFPILICEGLKVLSEKYILSDFLIKFVNDHCTNEKSCEMVFSLFNILIDERVFDLDIYVQKLVISDLLSGNQCHLFLLKQLSVHRTKLVDTIKERNIILYGPAEQDPEAEIMVSMSKALKLDTLSSFWSILKLHCKSISFGARKKLSWKLYCHIRNLASPFLRLEDVLLNLLSVLEAWREFKYLFKILYHIFTRFEGTFSQRDIGFLTEMTRKHLLVLHGLGGLEKFLAILQKEESLMTIDDRGFLSKVNIQVDSMNLSNECKKLAILCEFENGFGFYHQIYSSRENASPFMVCSSLNFLLYNVKSVEVLYNLLERDYYERSWIFNSHANGLDFLDNFVRNNFILKSSQSFSPKEIMDLAIFQFCTGYNVRNFNTDLIKIFMREGLVSEDDLISTVRNILKSSAIDSNRSWIFSYALVGKLAARESSICKFMIEELMPTFEIEYQSYTFHDSMDTFNFEAGSSSLILRRERVMLATVILNRQVTSKDATLPKWYLSFVARGCTSNLEILSEFLDVNVLELISLETVKILKAEGVLPPTLDLEQRNLILLMMNCIKFQRFSSSFLEENMVEPLMSHIKLLSSSKKNMLPSSSGSSQSFNAVNERIYILFTIIGVFCSSCPVGQLFASLASIIFEACVQYLFFGECVTTGSRMTPTPLDEKTTRVCIEIIGLLVHVCPDLIPGFRTKYSEIAADAQNVNLNNQQVKGIINSLINRPFQYDLTVREKIPSISNNNNNNSFYVKSISINNGTRTAHVNALNHICNRLSNGGGGGGDTPTSSWSIAAKSPQPQSHASPAGLPSGGGVSTERSGQVKVWEILEEYPESSIDWTNFNGNRIYNRSQIIQSPASAPATAPAPAPAPATNPPQYNQSNGIPNKRKLE